MEGKREWAREREEGEQKKSVISQDIIFPRPDDGSIEPKHYNVDFLSH